MSFWASDTETGEIKQVYHSEELSTKVFETIEWYENRYKELKKENEQLRKDAAKEVNENLLNQIKRYQEEDKYTIARLHSDLELKRYINFCNYHGYCRETSKYNGGRFPYVIQTFCGIGTKTEVICPICDQSKDITDTEVW